MLCTHKSAEKGKAYHQKRMSVYAERAQKLNSHRCRQCLIKRLKQTIKRVFMRSKNRHGFITFFDDINFLYPLSI